MRNIYLEKPSLWTLWEGYSCAQSVKHTGIHLNKFSGVAEVCINALGKVLQASTFLPLEGLASSSAFVQKILVFYYFFKLPALSQLIFHL